MEYNFSRTVFCGLGVGDPEAGVGLEDTHEIGQQLKVWTMQTGVAVIEFTRGHSLPTPYVGLPKWRPFKAHFEIHVHFAQVVGNSRGWVKRGQESIVRDAAEADIPLKVGFAVFLKAFKGQPGRGGC